MASIQFTPQELETDGTSDSDSGMGSANGERKDRDAGAQRMEAQRLAMGRTAPIYGRRGSRPPQEMARVVGAIATSTSLFDYSCYPKFSSLVTLREELRPKQRPIAWLMRLIEEIYDDRYAHDTADLRGDLADDPKEEGQDRLSNIFPVFVVDFLSKRYGLRQLVDQHCWDLLYNLHAIRKEHLEVEIFARFLEEYYDPDDLLFFLYVRSVIQKELSINFRNRWSELGRGRERVPKAVSLNYRECVVVSRVVFGSEADPLFRAFMSMIERHLVGAKRAKTDTRRIEVTQFLHLALVEYHETRPAEDEAEIAAAEAADLSDQYGQVAHGEAGGGGARALQGGAGAPLP